MNKKIASEIAIGIVLLLAILMGGIFWFNSKNELINEKVLPNNELESNKQTLNTVADEFKDWQTYKRNDVGFQFKVPADWKALSVYDSFKYKVCETDTSSSVTIVVYDNSSDATAEKLLKQYTESQSENRFLQHNNLKIISVAGVKGISYKNNATSNQVGQETLEIPRGNKLLAIVYSYDTLIASEDIFDKIISTAKFTKLSNNDSNIILEGVEPSITSKAGSSSKELIVDNLYFSLPNNWVIAKEENGKAYIENLSYKSKYDVFLSAQIEKSVVERSGIDDGTYNSRQIKVSGGTITSEMFGGAVAGYFINANGYEYQIVWGVNGNEPAPENIEGIWGPAHDFSEKEIEEMMKTLSIK